MNENIKNFINSQICVCKTSTRLIEMIGNLKLSPVEHYAHIHANGELVDGRKKYSRICIKMEDYSNGTGDKRTSVWANILPEEASYFFNQVSNLITNFKYEQVKIFGNPNIDGLSKTSKLIINRSNVSHNGEIKRYPWYIQIENGYGVKEKTATGGNQLKSGTYKVEKSIYINLTDLDFYIMFKKATNYINLWEKTFAPSLIISGIEKQSHVLQERIKNPN